MTGLDSPRMRERRAAALDAAAAPQQQSVADGPAHENGGHSDDMREMRGLTKGEQAELRKDKTLVRDSRWNTIGQASLMLLMFVIGRWPQHFWFFHFAFMMFLIPFRYLRSREQGWELYMLDFCYFAGCYYSFLGVATALLRVTLGIETWLAPYNGMLFRALFAYASGPLSIAVFIFRNNLVPFDPDHTTSVWLHISPALTVWTIRWGGGLGFSAFERAWPGMAKVCPGVDPEVADSCMMNVWCDACPARRREFFWYPLVIYFWCWVIPFYLIMFWVLEGWIERTGKATLFGEQRKSKDFRGRLIRSVPKRLEPVVYLSMHALHILLSSGVGWLFWHSFPLHTAYLVFTLLTAVHNGSNYIFKVFSLRYFAERVEAARVREKAELKRRRESEGNPKLAVAALAAEEDEARGRWRRRAAVAAVVVPYFAALLYVCEAMA